MRRANVLPNHFKGYFASDVNSIIYLSHFKNISISYANHQSLQVLGAQKIAVIMH